MQLHTLAGQAKVQKPVLHLMRVSSSSLIMETTSSSSSEGATGAQHVKDAQSLSFKMI